MNKKNIKSLALASIFSFSLTIGKFDQNKVCACYVPEIIKFIMYGSIGAMTALGVKEIYDSTSNNNIDNNKDGNNSNSSNNLINLLVIDNKKNMPFPNVPFFKWQDGNCFLLANFGVLYGPENIEEYKKVANMGIEKAGQKYLEFCRRYNYVDLSQFGVVNDNFHFYELYFEIISQHLVYSNQEFRAMIRGFIELCKLFVRVHDNMIPGEPFQIVPQDPIDKRYNEYSFEELIYGGRLVHRITGSGEPHEVFMKFVSHGNPLLLAFGDKSRYATWFLPYGKVDNISEIKFGIEGENWPFTMDQNGKISINGKEYYLAAFYRGQGNRDGHIVCRQPKYKRDANNNIKLDGVLKLSCLNNPHIYEKFDNMVDVLNEYSREVGGANFGARFVPADEMLKCPKFYFCEK